MLAMRLNGPGQPLTADDVPVPPPLADKSCSRSRRAVSAVPICTSSTASCRTSAIRSFLATKSSAESSPSAQASRRCKPATAWECPGSAIPAASAAIAAQGLENLCDRPHSRATRSTAATRSLRRPTRVTASDPCSLHRRAGRAAVVRRIDRLSRIPCGRRCPESRPLRLRGGRTFARSDRVRRGRHVFAFTRAGDTAGQGFARAQGAVWAGGSESRRPSRSTPRSCSRPSVRSFRPRSLPCAKAAASYAPAST